MNARRLLIDRVCNMRELGGYPTTDGGVTCWKRFIRSSAPFDLTEDDLQYLRDYGIRTVIDLRSGWEVSMKPTPFADASGFAYYNLSFTDDFTHLGTPDYCPLTHLVPVIQGEHRACEILNCMADADGGVLFYCHAGKDRTGMVAALLLLIAGVPVEDVISDYQTTFTYIKRDLATIITEEGRDLSLCRTDPEWIEPFIAHVLSDGGIDGFARRLGMTETALARLRDKLLR